MGTEATQPKPGQAKPPEKMVPEGQLVAAKKELNQQLTGLKGQLTTTQQQLVQAQSELEFYKATTDGDAEGKIKEIKNSIIQMNLDLSKKEAAIVERETKLAQAEIMAAKSKILSDFPEVKEEDLEGCKTPEEMKAKASDLAYQRIKENPPTAKGKGKGYEFGASSSASKPVTQMTDAEFAEHLKRLKSDANART